MPGEPAPLQVGDKVQAAAHDHDEGAKDCKAAQQRDRSMMTLAPARNIQDPEFSRQGAHRENEEGRRQIGTENDSYAC